MYNTGLGAGLLASAEALKEASPNPLDTELKLSQVTSAERKSLIDAMQLQDSLRRRPLEDLKLIQDLNILPPQAPEITQEDVEAAGLSILGSDFKGKEVTSQQGQQIIAAAQDLASKRMEPSSPIDINDITGWGVRLAQQRGIMPEHQAKMHRQDAAHQAQMMRQAFTQEAQDKRHAEGIAVQRETGERMLSQFLAAHGLNTRKADDAQSRFDSSQAAKVLKENRDKALKQYEDAEKQANATLTSPTRREKFIASYSVALANYNKGFLEPEKIAALYQRQRHALSQAGFGSPGAAPAQQAPAQPAAPAQRTPPRRVPRVRGDRAINFGGYRQTITSAVFNRLPKADQGAIEFIIDNPDDPRSERILNGLRQKGIVR